MNSYGRHPLPFFLLSGRVHKYNGAIFVYVHNKI